VKQTMSLEDLLARSVPYLFSVTINGLKDDQIVSLDQGNFDLVGFMAAVKKAGYRGQVGLQGYGVPGPSADHLGRSMNRWKEIMKKI